MRKYDHLFFDLDNTLWDFDANARLALQQAVTSLKLEDQVEDFDAFYTFFDQTNAGLWESYRRQEISQSELIRKRFEVIIDHFYLPGTDPEVFNSRYLQFMPGFTNLVEGALETLDYLRSEGYHLHIITNGLSEVQRQKVKNSGLAPYFEWITASEDIHVPKPDKRIFQYALMNCNARKNKSLMIGDNWETDIIGAMQTGIDYIFFVRNGTSKTEFFLNRIKSFDPNRSSSDRTKENCHIIQKLIHLKQIL